MGITNESKEQLRASVDIVDVVSDSLELKKAGANFKGCCPFHGEKTPSFTVSPSKQIYHCFGCGVGGDVFKFVQELFKMSFPEAVEEVARRHNFTLQYDSNGGKRKDYSRVLDALTAFYMKDVPKDVLKYLESRGLSKKSIKLWQIGYAPRSPETLKFIESNMLPKGELEELKLLRTGERGVYAHFTQRVMFPVHNHLGKVVGFSGRTLKTDTKMAKYVNSMDSAVFDKSRILFGFDKAKEHVYAKKFCIIMEGQLDVILSHQVGIQTAVASQGTALTEQHVPMLKKSGAQVILAYDGDKAGRAAALKGAMLLSRHSVSGGVVLFPEGMDAAQMVAEKREDELKRLLTIWTEMIRYVLEQIVAGFDLRDARQKSEALKQCKQYLDSLGDAVVADAYVGMVAGLVGVDVQYVAEEMPVVKQGKSSGAVSVEEFLIYAMYSDDGLIDECVNIIDDEAWENKDLYAAVLGGRADDVLMAEILLKEDLFMLSRKQFLVSVKKKQKMYLKRVKCGLEERGATLEEIVAVNEKIKEL